MPLVLVRRWQERLGTEMPWSKPELLPQGEKLKERLVDFYPGLSTLGLELDVMPVAWFNRLTRKSLSGLELVDVSPLIREARIRKTAYEINRMKAAARTMDTVYRAAVDFLTPGLTELEFESKITSMARNQGHQGVIRFRGFNQEIYWGHVLSGTHGLVKSKIESPTGGVGVGPGFGQGASHRYIGPNELVSVDICGTDSGYIVDQTRLYYTGKASEKVETAYNALLHLVADLLNFIRPGVTTGQVYDQAFYLAEKYRIGEHFMGPENDRCPFVGHGVGLELDELPILAKDGRVPLQTCTTFALEPRIFIPEVGVIGTEDTYLLTPSGPQYITITPRRIFEVFV